MRNKDDLFFFDDSFEWQISKAKENVKKHKITFKEATEVFIFGATQYYTDDSHSFDEQRYYAVGYTIKGNLLVVCYMNEADFISFRRGKLMQTKEKIMKKNATNSKTTVSKTEKGLKHLRLVGIGREYVVERLAEMQKYVGQKVSQSDVSLHEANGEKEKK